jgi:hypothetical protein
MNKYDPKDFAANPGKYRLFKTATIAKHIFTCDGDDDLSEGLHVGIEYRCEAFNKLFGRFEPVYTIINTEHGKVSGQRDLYANTLMNFVL